jgi:hypothetical protein
MLIFLLIPILALLPFTVTLTKISALLIARDLLIQNRIEKVCDVFIVVILGLNVKMKVKSTMFQYFKVSFGQQC